MTDQHIEHRRRLGRPHYLAIGTELILNLLDYRTCHMVRDCGIRGACGFNGERYKHRCVEPEGSRPACGRAGLSDITGWPPAHECQACATPGQEWLLLARHAAYMRSLAAGPLSGCRSPLPAQKSVRQAPAA